MESTTYTAFRKQMKYFLDMVRNEHTPLLVTNAKGEDVIIISKADYESILETIYLLKSPNNASRLLNGIDQYEKGLNK